jgi:O-succinylhomoserine sulfhydrylase
MKKPHPKQAAFETIALRKQLPRTGYAEHSTPVFLTSSFVFDDAEDMRASFAEEKQKDLYSRYTNPNTNEFVNKMVALEKAESGCAFATGMAAIYATLAALLQQGDHILACRALFGATNTLMNKYLPRWGIETTYFDIDEVDRLDHKRQKNTRLLFVETPTNPSVDILDLQKLGEFARQHNLLLVVDNTFATPYLQQPIVFGADVVVHSATKFIDGQGRVLGGVAVGKAPLIEEIYLFGRISGPSLSPFNAWLLSKSLETLAVRMDRHCQNAMQVAQYLESQPRVAGVKYPFLESHPSHELARRQMRQGGSLIAFELTDGLAAGRRFLDKLKMCSLSANLGDSRTIATHPASTTHSKLSPQERAQAGISDGLVRLSVGLEHIDDIIADLDQALASE